MDGPLVDSAPSPSGLAIGNESGAALRRALARLSEDHRSVIELRLDQGKSFDEIGQKMGRSPAAVRKLWARAMERFR